MRLNEEKNLNFVSLYSKMNKIRENPKKFMLEEGHPNALANIIKYQIIYDELKSKL